MTCLMNGPTAATPHVPHEDIVCHSPAEQWQVELESDGSRKVIVKKRREEIIRSSLASTKKWKSFRLSRTIIYKLQCTI